jgi:hypothetical protein
MRAIGTPSRDFVSRIRFAISFREFVSIPAQSCQNSIMNAFPDDIYAEPEPDPDTLSNLGPLTCLAGIWEGKRGVDRHPEATGPVEEPYIERIDMQPIDAQTNGPQLFYGLRYHVFIVRPENPETFHDQVGYWLWEPATGTVIQTLAIPRAQVAMAIGHASADATSFELIATRDSTTNGICSNPFIEHAFKTIEYRIRVTINPGGTWSYEQDTVMLAKGQTSAFHHTDRNTLTRIAPPTPNPMARALSATERNSAEPRKCA